MEASIVQELSLGVVPRLGGLVGRRAIAPLPAPHRPRFGLPCAQADPKLAGGRIRSAIPPGKIQRRKPTWAGKHKMDK